MKDAAQPEGRKPDAVQFQALAASIGLANDDRSSVVLLAHTHCAQRVAVRLTRTMALELAGEIALLEGCKIQRTRWARRASAKSAPATNSSGESPAKG